MHPETIIFIIALAFGLSNLATFLLGRWLGRAELAEQVEAARISMVRSVHLAAEEHARAARKAGGSRS